MRGRKGVRKRERQKGRNKEEKEIREGKRDREREKGNHIIHEIFKLIQLARQ